jgi:hypothetical protein
MEDRWNLEMTAMTRTGTGAAALALFAALLIGQAPAAEERDAPKDDLKTLRDDLEKLKGKTELDARLTNAELRLINGRLDRIEQALDRLESKTRTTTRSAFAPRGDDTGTLRLDNRMAVEAAVTVDGVTYRVPPLSRRTLRDRPAGAWEDSVTGPGMGLSRRRTVLNRNETLTVTITPPPPVFPLLFDD